ncbi:MAG: 4-(cytidine 5'-diphospho)-2-C-methyl-D-erythritol kinase [Sphingomonas sp.]
MTTITEVAPAKINLALHVRRRRPDGYHDIETLFAFLRHGDVLHVSPAAQDSFAITGPFAQDLSGETGNLVLAARDAFAAAFGPIPALAVTLDKRLPVASGIGGGSADAAAMLRVLARLRGVALDGDDLLLRAAELGADVPACLLGRAALGTGTGTELHPIDGLEGLPILLVNPRVGVSTAAVFRAWDGVDRGPLPAGDALTSAASGHNDLEPAARAVAPAIDAVLETLAAMPGVMLSRMSGSGATCFALFGSKTQRTAAAEAVAAEHPDWWLLASSLA